MKTWSSLFRHSVLVCVIFFPILFILLFPPRLLLYRTALAGNTVQEMGGKSKTHKVVYIGYLNLICRVDMGKQGLLCLGDGAVGILISLF